MTRRTTRRRSGLLGAVALVSCSGGLAHPPYSPQATTALGQVDTTPPPGRVEVVPGRPAGADAWVDGEWVLRHGRWYWLLGRWVKTPTDTTYSPWVVVRATDGTPYYAPSVWRGADGGVTTPPQPMAFARASGEAVMSPEGDVEDTGRVLKTAPSARPPDAGPPEQAPEAPPRGTP